MIDDASVKYGRSSLMQEFQPMERGEKDRGLLPREAPGGTRSPAVVGEELDKFDSN
jgi:hypothetical protein